MGTSTDIQQVHLRLPADLHKRLTQLAEDDDRSLNALVRVALKEYAAHREEAQAA